MPIDNLGLTFSPGGLGGSSPSQRPASSPPAQDAIRVLSLNVPKSVNAPVPQPLLGGRGGAMPSGIGGGAPGAPPNIGAMLASLFQAPAGGSMPGGSMMGPMPSAPPPMDLGGGGQPNWDELLRKVLGGMMPPQAPQAETPTAVPNFSFDQTGPAPTPVTNPPAAPELQTPEASGQSMPSPMPPPAGGLGGAMRGNRGY